MTTLSNWPLETRLLLCFALAVWVAGLLNWAIYRLAWNSRRMSPWSSPPVGLPPRTFADRIPILGWLRLRREAFHWGTGFWVRPLLLEICFGIAITWLYLFEVNAEGLSTLAFPAEAFANPWPKPSLEQVSTSLFAAHALLFCLLIVITFIDIDEKTIPDDVTLPGTLLGLLLVTLNPWMLPSVAIHTGGTVNVDFVHFLSPSGYHAGDPTGGELAIALGCLWFWVAALLPRVWHGRAGIRRAWKYFWIALFCGRRRRETMMLLAIGLFLTLGVLYTWFQAGVSWVGLLSGLAGMACGTLLIWSIRLVGRATLKKEAMGFGDVTLMAMIGSFLGWQATLLVFFIAPFAGLAVGLIQFVLRKGDVVPYGPFLCMATVVVLLAWPHLWDHAGPIFAGIGSLLPILLVACLGLMAVLLAVWYRIKKRCFSRTDRA